MRSHKSNPKEKILIDPVALRRYRMMSQYSTVQALADETDLSRSYISMLETGKYEQISFAIAVKIAGALGLSSPYELSGRKQPQLPTTRRELFQRIEDMAAGQYYTLGEVFRVEKKWEDSAWHFGEAILRNKNYTPAYLGLAECLLEQARCSKDGEIDLLISALENCNIAIGQNLGFESGDDFDKRRAAPTYLIRAKVRDQLGRIEEAKADIVKALSLWDGIKRFMREDDFPNLSRLKLYDELICRGRMEEAHNGKC